MKYLFVGERPSKRALELKLTWHDGGLAAKTLFRALRECGINPIDSTRVQFTNIFDMLGREMPHTAAMLLIAELTGWRIVAMGRTVERYMECHHIPHRFIYHPAARGKIRSTEVYIQHVCQSLAS